MSIPTRAPNISGAWSATAWCANSSIRSGSATTPSCGCPTARPRCATMTATVVRYEGTVRDITNQKRAEAAVTEGRRLLQQVIDTVPAVINVKNTELRYVLMNRYMAGIFGIEPGDAIGQTTGELMSRYGASKTDSPRQAGAGDGQGAWLLRGGIQGRRRRMMRQWLVNKHAAADAPTARSRTSSRWRSISASASAASRRCARPRMPPRRRCAICARPRIR